MGEGEREKGIKDKYKGENREIESGSRDRKG